MKFTRWFLLLLFSAAPLVAGPTDEIETLLSYVRQLDRAVFVRNGTEHSGSKAADHLRTKWEKQTARIKTAEDFIEHCASKSSVSGERYKIRYADGSEKFADEVLRAELARLREKSPPKAAK